MFEQLAFARHF